MENLDEKNKRKETNNGIKEERLKALKENYVKPEFYGLVTVIQPSDDRCSDMASSINGGACGDLTKRCSNYYDNR